MRSEEAPVLADVDMVQRCLEGSEEAISEMKRSLTPFLGKVLSSYGASKDEIDEILAQLWGDCLTGQRPLFHVFNGKSALRSWLTAISVNRWISLKRREAQHARAMQHLAIASEPSPATGRSGSSQTDASIIEILGPALRRAFAACDVEELILLQLVHMHGVTQREIASLWKWHESRVSRHIKRAEAKIAERTLQAVKETDPYLELRWNDFVELCRSVELLRQ
ncbi:MAG: RNA polymerase sigma factor [Terrimicrobiaceae bacterium]